MPDAAAPGRQAWRLVLDDVERKQDRRIDGVVASVTTCSQVEENMPQLRVIQQIHREVWPI